MRLAKCRKAQFCRTGLTICGEDKSHIPTDERLLAVQAGENDPTLDQLLFDYGKYLTISSSQHHCQKQ